MGLFESCDEHQATASLSVIKSRVKGMKNLEPGGSKDPCPFEVCLMIAGWFLDKGFVMMAAFVVLCFDTYVRPGVMSVLKRSNILTPSSHVHAGYKHWSLVLSPSVEGVPTKVGEFDDSLIVGSKGREWISKVLEKLWRHSNPNATLFFFLVARNRNPVSQCFSCLGSGAFETFPPHLKTWRTESRHLL